MCGVCVCVLTCVGVRIHDMTFSLRSLVHMYYVCERKREYCVCVCEYFVCVSERECRCMHVHAYNSIYVCVFFGGGGYEYLQPHTEV